MTSFAFQENHFDRGMCAIVKRRARHEGQQSDPGLAEHGTVGTPEGLAYHRTQVMLSSRPEGQREELTEENRHFQVNTEGLHFLNRELL